MFKTKPVVRHDQPIELLPNCMYKIKNLHGTTNGLTLHHNGNGDHVSLTNKNNSDITEQNIHNNIPGMAELEIRQEQILKQLNELRQQLQCIRDDLKINKSAVSTVCSTAKTTTTREELVDIVVNANPNQPPFALEIAQKLLLKHFNISVTYHLHSSISSLPEPARILSQNLINFKGKTNVPVLNLRLIWKKIDANAELIVSHLPIHGEVNLLRYLSRLNLNELNYNGNCEIDSLLDVCYLIAASKNKTARTQLLDTLSKSLEKSQFLCGQNNIGIADIAAVSAIKQSGSTRELNATLNKWLKRCETVV